jgi:uncharacterized zinc-type alcohol dehydrogenase-like protein
LTQINQKIYNYLDLHPFPHRYQKNPCKPEKEEGVFSMSNVKITGYAALEPGAKLTPFTYEQPPLKNDEVRIAITHCGLCGTDIQAIDDIYSEFKFPLMPGHEVVGTIIEVGSDVPPTRIGERVGVGWQGRACGHCEWCLKGDVHLCMDVVNNSTWTPYGGFSSSITVDEAFAYPLPEEMPSEVAAVLMCAGFTVYSALSRRCTSPSLRLGILGIGGLGHLAIQFAKAMGYEVTALSSSPGKQELALSLGGDNFIDISDQTALRQAAYYFDLLFITSHGGILWDRMLEILKKKGEIVLAAFPEVNLNPVDLVAHEISITGAFLGTQAEMRAMLQYASANNIQPMIEIMPMSQVNQAIDKLRQNKARFRIVLKNDLVK